MSIQSVKDAATDQNFRSLDGRFPIQQKDLADGSVGADQIEDGAVTPAKLSKREVVGAVNAEGTILNGSGFTCEKTATGKYTIKVSTALSSAGAIFVELNGSFTQVHKSTGPSTTEWKIQINGFNLAVPGLEAASEAFSFFIKEI